ncbi:MAG: riboflavin biosynthesis protein RibF [Candidatus Omnitrophica bacterium]|jgi:riboflavin kinase/FMN adenylyltransferase|nr:riboflavin biosynthesis protein RibF [Candidatus Omnitrophota bacterium]MDD5078780.1 riboflavin biosynthesis protein RibF [Candidatus Omnitrophota bacterium]
MRTLYDLKSLKNYRRPVVAVGVFDGLHRGHRMILKEAVHIARRTSGTSMVLTFWPHPQKQESLYSLQHRLKIMEGLGIEVCAVIRFDRNFSRMGYEEFIRDILADKIRARYVCVGNNFRFGKGARGGIADLKKAARLYGFRVRAFRSIRTDNRVVSSTNIRRLISEGRLKTAERLLLRPVSVFGRVIRGTRLATKMGWPTANINPHHEVVPPAGVYAVKVVYGGNVLNGICYIGKKPTFVRSERKKKYRNIEVHIFNFHKNIYKKDLEIQFVRKIRGERKFSGIPELTRQIEKDIRAAKTRR